MTHVNNLINLSGKVAVITGSATGLGATAAAMLSRAGAHVVINHLSGQEDAANTVAQNCPGETLCFAADITCDEQCVALVDAVLEKWGSVDILVNNAGINKFVEHNDLDGLTSEDFADIFKVNVTGAYLMTRAVSGPMKKQGSGVIVNISSAAGINGGGSCIAYAASKGAINTMTKSLGRALAPEIRVNTVCPAFMNTPIWEKRVGNIESDNWKKQRNAFKSATPLQIEGNTEIASRSILFLASDLSAHLTGELITSDGGLLLGKYQSMFSEGNQS